MHAIDYIPIWLVFFIFIGVAFLCVEYGYRLAKHRKYVGAPEPEVAVGAMTASTLALLAFVLGFTFNLAASRFEERRAAVLAESNAIGTTYLRAGFLEQPSKDHVRQLLRQYVALRTSQGSQLIADTNSKSDSLQTELWAEATTAANNHPNSPICALFISTLNEMIDIHAKRIAAAHARVPLIVWLCLTTVSALAMGGIGFMCGLAGYRSFYGTSTLVAAFGLVMLLVADLDRPLQGLIQTPQQPMVDLLNKIGPP
ncbi:MAG TPA: hypothetical protein V6C97_24335 [Oculatellaceae cyanobacterium]